MKCLRFAIAASLCMLAVASCKKNDSTPTGPAALVGKWQGQKVQVVYSLNGQQQGDTTLNITSPNYLILDFRADSTLIINSRLSFFGDSTGTTDTTYYLVKSGKIVLTNNLQDTNGYGQADYQLSGSQLLLHEEQTDTTQQGVEKNEITFYLKRM